AAVTEAGSVKAMVGLGAVLVVFLWWRRERLMALACAAAMAGGASLNVGLKLFFKRDRPWFGDPVLRWIDDPEHNAHDLNRSFPSGHSMGAVIGYGLLGFTLVLFLPNRTLRVVALTVLTVVVLLVGFSRIYLGAHYFSDVMGGYAAAAAWLSAWL